MQGKNLPTLQKLLEDAGSVRPLGELRERGIKRIRVLSESQLTQAMRIAFNRALRHQLGSLDLPAAVLERLREAAEWEYRSLLADGLEHVTPDFPTTLVTPPPTPSAPSADLPRVPPPNLDPGSPEFHKIEERMAHNLTELVRKDWRTELAAATRHQQDHLEALEQRIGKLVQALESTDRVLHRIQQVRPTESAPLGANANALDPASPLFERKSELLTALFQANMELRELRGAGAKNP